MGIVLVAIVPSRFSSRDGIELRAAARSIVDGLQRTRSLALSSGAPALFAIDVDRRLFQAPDAAAPVALPPQARLSLKTVRGEMADRSVGGIRFFPDGGSTGGGITIGADGSQYRIAVSWLTGRVEIADAPR